MEPFKFKEFIIRQDKTAMKVGTDAVLLGAWCSLHSNPDTILDVGSGTGIIALMLAQRSNAMTIDAVEIDAEAYEQSVENFEQSDWGDRLFCYNAYFQEFAGEIAKEEEQYDLIISNPPFYTDVYETENTARNKARFTSSLSFEDLLKNTSVILSQSGTFVTILPFKEEEEFVLLAKKYNLFLNRVCHVRGNTTSRVKRSLLEFSFKKNELQKEDLTIEVERHRYTQEYVDLTQDFYLKM